MPSIINATTTNGVAISPDNSGSLQLATNNGTTAVTIDTSQNVGIGTTTPLYTFANRGSLTINGTNQALLALSSGSSTSTSGYLIWDSSTSNLSINNQSTSGALIFGTNGSTARMSINNLGNTAITGSGASFGQATLIVQNTNNVNNAWTYRSILPSASNTGSAVHFAGLTTGASEWYLLGNGTSSWSSDINLKKNVETTRNGYIDDLCKLRVVKYNWKNHEDTAPKELGLIAQEVEEVFPNLVMDSLAPDDDGVHHKMIKGSVLPYMMLKAIQELKAELDTVKAELQALKGTE